MGQMLCKHTAPMAAPCSSESTSLLDLPDELLARCLPEDSASCISASQACRRLLFLTGCRAWLGGYETSASWQAEGARAYVAKLFKLFPGLHKLALRICQFLECKCEPLLEAFFSAPAAVEPGANWMQELRHLAVDVEHEDLYEDRYWGALSSVLPPGIATACPSLSHINLSYIFVRSTQGAYAECMPQLQRLQMSVDCKRSDPVAFQQQLQGLPGLQDLECCAKPGSYTATHDATVKVPKVCTAIANALSGQLTRMHFEMHKCNWWHAPHATALLSQPYPNLRVLELPALRVDDATLDVLLQQAPQVHSITVRAFKLLSSHSSKQCSWESVHIYEVDVQSLALMPLGSTTTLAMVNKRYTHEVHLVHTGQGLAVDLRVTAAAVAAVQRCGGLKVAHNPQAEQVSVTLAARTQEDAVQRGQLLTTALPLLRHVTEVHMYDVHMSHELLIALGKLPSCMGFTFSKGCTFESDVWPHMLPALQRVTKLAFYTTFITTEAVLAMCSAANHSVTLTLVKRNPLFQDRREEVTHQVAQVSKDLVSVHWSYC